jgi:hypothetical protein
VLQPLLHEGIKTIALLQSLAILRIRHRLPHRVVRRKPDELAVWKIVVQVLYQLPFTPYAVKHLRSSALSNCREGSMGAPSLNTTCGNRGPDRVTPRASVRVWYGAGGVSLPGAPAKYTKLSVLDLQMFRACLTLRSS